MDKISKIERISTQMNLNQFFRPNTQSQERPEEKTTSNSFDDMFKAELEKLQN